MLHFFQKIKVITESKLGPCNRRKLGELSFVKDRRGKNNLLVCNKHEGRFRWRMTTDGIKIEISPKNYTNLGRSIRPRAFIVVWGVCGVDVLSPSIHNGSSLPLLLK